MAISTLQRRNTPWTRWFVGGTLYIGLLVLAIGPANAHIPLTNVAAVATGEYHTCALTTSGGVKCWGYNPDGQLGDGTNIDRETPVDVVGLSSGVFAISAGASHTCALMVTGGVKCWGQNDYGQLGDGSTADKLTPTDVLGLGSGVATIAAGYEHTCALTNTGGVKCWGDNFFGQLGDGTRNDHLTATDVTGLTSGVAAITVGLLHSCALTFGGGAKCWGDNRFGALGDGTGIDALTSVDVFGLTSGVMEIAGGWYHTCAVTNGGAVKCWGENNTGQLGDSTTSRRYAPVDAMGLASGVAKITAGARHSCARTNSGGAKCWGKNQYGQLGDGTTIDRSIATDVLGLTSGVVAIAAGSEHTCATTNTGGARCWGSNGVGRLGNGIPSRRATAVDVVGMSSGTSSIAVGGDHACARTTGGGVKCWGSNLVGGIGDGTTSNALIPVDVVGLASGVGAVGAGTVHTCALMNSGGLKCWGRNSNNELGDGTTTQRLTPMDVTGLASGIAGVVGGFAHTCALTVSGGVKCWGDNNYGQVGDATNNDRSTPVDVFGLTSGVASITAGDLHTCAVMVAGGAKCWGHNGYGQLGDSTNNHQSAPTDVVGLASGVVAIDGGEFHTCAVMAGGGVKCWGSNASGQLGNGDTFERDTPVDVSGLANGAIAVAAGDNHTCALTSTGGVRCWGANFTGQLGDGTFDDHLIPVNTIGLTGSVSSVAVGRYHSCARMSGGGVKCWGGNAEGALGNGEASYSPVPTVVFAQLTFAPAVATNPASSITTASATLNGVVSSNGLATAVTFQYGLTTSYGGTVSAVQSPLAAGAANLAVSAAIGGLACNANYHFRVVAVNTEGTNNGGDIAFTTAACAPTSATNAASGISATGATLNGTASSNGATTTVTFQYGLTTSYGTTVTATQSPLAADAVNRAVSAVINGLACSTTYHFRAVGVNGTGTTNGNDSTFATLSCPPQSRKLFLRRL